MLKRTWEIFALSTQFGCVLRKAFKGKVWLCFVVVGFHVASQKSLPLFSPLHCPLNPIPVSSLFLYNTVFHFPFLGQAPPPKGQCISQASSKELIIDGNYTETQSDSVQRMRDIGALSSKWKSIKITPLQVQRSAQNRGRKTVGMRSGGGL